MTLSLEFEPVGRRGECPAGGALLDGARQLGVDLVSLCRGAGSCGRCIVQIIAGNVSEPTPGEHSLAVSSRAAQGGGDSCGRLAIFIEEVGRGTKPSRGSTMEGGVGRWRWNGLVKVETPSTVGVGSA